MQISARSIDDFKTDRKGITPPLPIYLRLLPILFYLTIIATIILNGIFVLRLSQADRSRVAALKQESELQKQIASTKTERKELEDEAKKASDIVSWLDAARPLQPLVVAIARSIGAESSLQELHLDRDAENPAQIQISLRLNGEILRQLDAILAQIARLRFRSFSPQQSVDNGQITYKATLLWLDASARNKEPADS